MITRTENEPQYQYFADETQQFNDRTLWTFVEWSRRHWTLDNRRQVIFDNLCIMIMLLWGFYNL
jgi:hypothetical protein